MMWGPTLPELTEALPGGKTSSEALSANFRQSLGRRGDVDYPRPPPTSHGGHAVGLADLGDLPRVIVPVVVEHGADVYRQGDLVGPHELLKQGDLRLSPQIGVGEGFEIAEDLTALSLERVEQLCLCHLQPFGCDVRLPGCGLDQREAGGREAFQRGPRPSVRLREQMAEDLAGGPFTRGVRIVQVRLHILKLTREIRRRRIALLL